MLIQLEQIREQPFRWQETVTIEPEVLQQPDLLALGPVSWRGQISFVDPGYFLSAHLSYEQQLACTRCLQPVTQPIEADVELLLLAHGEHAGAGEYELAERDMSVVHVEGEAVDLRPLLIEQLQLNVPMRVLCRPDCAGLCPVCGTDRNLATCDCEAAPADPRWAALAALKSRMPGS